MPNGGRLEAIADTAATVVYQEANYRLGYGDSGTTVYASGVSGYNYSVTVTGSSFTAQTAGAPSAYTTSTTGRFYVGFRGSHN